MGNSNNEEFLEQARMETRKSMREGPLALLDPFADGVAIPLEAQRLGFETHGHDLNPVAVVINKAMLEIPPFFAGKSPVKPVFRKDLRGEGRPVATGLAEDVRSCGEW